MTFVITGSLENYENRDELVKVIEDNGGKTASSVSKNTTYLINNDINSNSSKNKKAKELGIKIISENEFNELIQQ
jgi:DNA ligase (NAD+)